MTNTISSFESVELTAVSLRHQIQFRPEDESSSDSLTPIAIVTEDDSSIEYPEGGLKAYSVILGSFLGLIVNLGLINSIGAIQAYVSTHQLSNLKATSISWIFSIYLSLAYAGGIITGPIFDKRGPLEILIVATAFIFLGLMGAAQSVEIWQFILSFISLGVGSGLGTTPLIVVISHWFCKKSGSFTGFATSGGSIGGLIFPLMLRHTYNVYGYVWAIRILAFMSLGCMVCSIFLVKERFHKVKTEVIAQQTQKTKFSIQVLMNKLKSVNASDFKYIYVILGAFFAELSLILLVTYFPSYAIAQGASESTSLLLLTVWNATGILGRWIPGFVSDIYGRYNVYVFMLILYCLCIFVLLYPFGSSEKILYAFAGVGGYCSGSILGLLPACLSQITPVNEIGTKYGILNAVLSLANLFGIPIAASIIKDGTPKEYNNFVVLVGCLAVAGTLFWYFSRVAISGFKLNIKV
ncbi:hypothetical protein MGQ_04809 [Candida albicans P76067]|nr:hypothetical protein MEQ_04800 [Candida albicans P87]KHC31913.1 hypothetical protein MGQ_04809 [Candida albicans P76067]KHC63492.1 hypothetical protein MGI_04802 [Candida albicans P75016]KHC70942.1 hypothetical protein MGS_04857 [Candida albicans P78042]